MKFMPPIITPDESETIFSDWLVTACMTYQKDSNTIEPNHHTHLVKDDVLQLIQVVEKTVNEKWVKALMEQKPVGTTFPVEECPGLSQSTFVAASVPVGTKLFIAPIPTINEDSAPLISNLSPTQNHDLKVALGRALNTWEARPDWLVKWYDSIAGIPSPSQRDTNIP